jgi:biopolymer transport protein ExbD
MSKRLIVIVAALAFLAGLVVAVGLGTAILVHLQTPVKRSLPDSELASRLEPENFISVTLLANGNVELRDREHSIADLGRLLQEELRQQEGVSLRECTVVIYGQQGVPIGAAQEAIRICQATGFEKFALRAARNRR